MRKAIKAVIYFSFLVSIISCSNKWKTVYTTVFDWNNDGNKDKIILEIPKKWNDPGDFHKVLIKISGQPEFALENMDGWIKIENEIKNVTDNNYFLLYPITKNENALLLIGYGYASKPSRLDVITLNNNYPEVIFSEEMNIWKYQDFNNDSIPDFLLLPWLTEVYGPEDRYESYVPLLVYIMVKQNEHWKMVYDEKLSIQYTNDNLYGWAGREGSDSLVVFKPKNENKPRVMKLKEAEILYSKEK
jgi:hypothetical protein